MKDDRLAATQSINESLEALKVVGQVLLDKKIDDATVRHVAFKNLPQEHLVKALERADHLIRPEQDAYVDYFSKKHRSIQNFSKLLLEVLTFKSNAPKDGLLQGLEHIADIHQGKSAQTSCPHCHFISTQHLGEVKSLLQKGSTGATTRLLLYGY